MILGIDPGQSGGLCLLDSAGAIVWVQAMPETETDLRELLEEHREQIKLAVLEKVHGMPGMSVVAVSTFMKHYGFLRGVMSGLKIPFDEVTPQVWMKAMSIPARGEKSKSQHKNVLKAKAQQLFPTQKITLATADAILIATYATYGRRQG